MKASRWIALAGIGCLLAAGAWWVQVDQPAVRTERSVEQPQVPPAPAVPAVGERRVYRLSWVGSQARRLGSAAQLTGQIALEGRLEIIELPSAGGATEVVARLAELSRADLSLLGQAVDGAKLRGARAKVSSSRDGALESVSTAAGADPIVAHTFWGLFSRLQLTTPPRRREATPLGLREVSYTGTGPARRRVAERYVSVDGIPALAGLEQSLTASTDFRLASAGHIERLDSHEKLALSDATGSVVDASTQLSLELVERGPARSLPDTTGFVARDLEAARRRADARGLADRAKAVPRKNVVQTLQTFTGPKAMNDLPGWIWAASGRLLLEPGTSHDMAAAVSSGAVGLEGKRLAADLLAGAGHAPAQAALRAIFEHLHAQQAQELTELVQRAGLLALPEPATVALVRRLFEEGGANSLRTASAYTLGAMAGKLWRAGYQDESKELTALLLSDFEHASTPGQRAAATRAMGNAATPHVAEAIVAQADSAQAVEREAAAVASRQLDSTQAIQKLIELLVDPDPGVQRGAINALLGRLSPGPLLARVRDAVVSGAGHQVNDPLLVNLVSNYVDQPEGRQVLEFILGRSGGDPRLRARLRKLLGGT